MLQKLVIKNIALIDSVEICFEKGLNVLSGETGAGKSVIIESLNFVLGAKADRSLIRSGQNDCYVCAEFDVANNKSIQDAYNEFDLSSRAFDICVYKLVNNACNLVMVCIGNCTNKIFNHVSVRDSAISINRFIVV